jgi:hypothetical protein
MRDNDHVLQAVSLGIPMERPEALRQKWLSANGEESKTDLVNALRHIEPRLPQWRPADVRTKALSSCNNTWPKTDLESQLAS